MCGERERLRFQVWDSGRLLVPFIEIKEFGGRIGLEAEVKSSVLDTFGMPPTHPI